MKSLKEKKNEEIVHILIQKKFSNIQEQTLYISVYNVLS